MKSILKNLEIQNLHLLLQILVFGQFQPSKQRMPLGWPGSNPGRPRELFQNHVAMSKCTNWPPKLSTIMVIAQSTLNLQSCMVPFYVRSNMLIKMVYHSFCHNKCTINYDHICIQPLRSILFVRLQSYQLSAIIEKVKSRFKMVVKVAFFNTKMEIVYYT